MEYRASGFDVFAQPAGAGIAVVPARALGHELADLGYEGERRVDVLDGVELLLELVRCEPEVGVPAGLVVGHHTVVHEAGDADAALCVAFLPAGEFQLDDAGGLQPALGAGTGLLPLLALEFSHVALVTGDAGCY